MVHMMSSRPKVKLEEFLDSWDFNPLPKRSKFRTVTSLQCGGEGEDMGVLEEPSPLGLRLKKSPSFLDLIQMRLSRQNSSKKKKEAADKLKASNFTAVLLKIGTWEYKSRYEGDLVGKCYFAKHKLVWEMLDGGLKNKIEIQWSDIVAIKANYSDDGPDTLDLVLARQPLFFRETNPQPRKHTLWKATSDFTCGQASLNRRHLLQCPPGLLARHFEKLVQCDPRLHFLSQQPEIFLESPFFEPTSSVYDDTNESASIPRLDICVPAAVPATQTPSSADERDFFNEVPEDVCQPTLSPNSGKPCAKLTLRTRKEYAFFFYACVIFPSFSPLVIDRRAIEKFPSSGMKGPEKNDCKTNGIRQSVSISDLLSRIGHCISQEMTSGNPMFSADNLQGRDIMGEISQCLLSDTQLVSASDEEIMSRVNSLCCLLQKDGSLSAEESKGYEVSQQLIGKSEEAPQDKQLDTISRNESLSDLLLSLPRIASLPQFLYTISEDY